MTTDGDRLRANLKRLGLQTIAELVEREAQKAAKTKQSYVGFPVTSSMRNWPPRPTGPSTHGSPGHGYYVLGLATFRRLLGLGPVGLWPHSRWTRRGDRDHGPRDIAGGGVGRASRDCGRWRCHRVARVQADDDVLAIFDILKGGKHWDVN